VAPFGSAAADVDESDAAQLWSTAYLAVRPARVVTGVTVGARVASRADVTLNVAAALEGLE
jgi:hypothetical protein